MSVYTAETAAFAGLIYLTKTWQLENISISLFLWNRKEKT